MSNIFKYLSVVVITNYSAYYEYLYTPRGGNIYIIAMP